METLFLFIVGIVAWMSFASLLYAIEPKSGKARRIFWFIVWVFTLSFLFGNSSSANTSTPPNYYGEGDNDECDEDFNFWEDDNDNYYSDNDDWDMDEYGDDD